jgi:hypothetical protein
MAAEDSRLRSASAALNFSSSLCRGERWNMQSCRQT